MRPREGPKVVNEPHFEFPQGKMEEISEIQIPKGGGKMTFTRNGYATVL